MSPVKTLSLLFLLLFTLSTLSAETDEERFNRLKSEALSYLEACAEGTPHPNGMLYAVYYINGNQAQPILTNAANRLEGLDYTRLLELTGTLGGTPSLIERVQYALAYNEEGWDRNAPMEDMDLTERLEHIETATRSLSWLALVHALQEDEGASSSATNQRMATTLRGSLEPSAQVLQPPEGLLPAPQEEPYYLFLSYIDAYSQLIHHLHLFRIQDPQQVYLFFILLTYPLHGSF